MPIYQYKCTDCGHQLEAIQKMSDPKLVDCPACKAASLVKQVTAASFKLKGTGWYETDFKNSGAKPAAANAKTGTQETSSKQSSESSASPDASAKTASSSK